MKIGIMGGTFDPIHDGHLKIAEYALKQYRLDIIRFLPNGNPPHKDNTSIGSDINDRVEMIKLAISNNAKFILEEYEIEGTGVSYSYATMEYLNAKYPEDELYFILGADSLFNIEKWKYPDRLFKTCIILAAYREDTNTKQAMSNHIEYLKNKYKADVRLLKSPLIDISSHDIRDDLERGADMSSKLPKAVYTYIKSRHLYNHSSI